MNNRINFIFVFILMIFSNLSMAEYKLILSNKVISFSPVENTLEDSVMDLSPSAWYTSEDISVDGTGSVETLEDITGNGNGAVKLYGDLKIQENGLNGYPVLESFGDSMFAPLDTRGLEGMTVFNVLSGDVIGFSNYTYSPLGGFMVFRRNIHGRPDGGDYIQTQLQSTNNFAISTAVVKDGEMAHYVNGVKKSSLAIGNFKVGVSGIVLLGRPYVNTNANNTNSNGYGAEIIVFNRVLTPEEMETVDQYLNDKYALF